MNPARGIVPRGRSAQRSGILARRCSRCCRAPPRTIAAPGSAARRPGHRLSMARLAAAAGDSVRRNAHVSRGRGCHWQADGDASGRPRLCHESGRAPDSLPSRHSHRRLDGWLPLGDTAQERFSNRSARAGSDRCCQVRWCATTMDDGLWTMDDWTILHRLEWVRFGQNPLRHQLLAGPLSLVQATVLSTASRQPPGRGRHRRRRGAGLRDGICACRRRDRRRGVRAGPSSRTRRPAAEPASSSTSPSPSSTSWRSSMACAMPATFIRSRGADRSSTCRP